jgi:zinc/manganese transport system substrate-binding protein
MHKITPIIVALAMVAACALPAAGQLRIVTTTPEYADLARQIGGDKVTVRSVMQGPENVHNVLANPPEMLALNKADLFLHSGLDAEPWRDNLLKGARNPRVLAGQPGNVDMSVGIELRDVPAGGKVDRSQGDMHAYGDPHFYIDPRAAQRMAVTVAKALAAVDPPNAEFYLANARAFITDMAEVYKQLLTDLAPLGRLKVVTFHPAWGYFADAFGLEVVTTIEPKPGISPSPAQMRQVVQTMKEKGVRIVIVETWNSVDQARRVADQAGATCIVLPDHVNGVEQVKTYQDLFRHNVGSIIAAARGAGPVPAGQP